MLKKCEDDPNVERKKAALALARFLRLHPHNIAQKTEVMVEHFNSVTRHKIRGRAKGMVVTGSRLEAVRYKESFDKYIKLKGYPKHGGNTLDFIARMGNISIHAAALKAVEWFKLDPEAMSADSGDGDNSDGAPANESASRSKSLPKKTVSAPENNTPNKPLKFRLDKLEREHPYLAERGLTLETIVDFGIGFCGKGMMAGHIAIPIHNPEGGIRHHGQDAWLR